MYARQSPSESDSTSIHGSDIGCWLVRINLRDQQIARIEPGMPNFGEMSFAAMSSPREISLL
jgi:hypothetical protein